MNETSKIRARVLEFEFPANKLEMFLNLPVGSRFASIEEISVQRGGYSLALEARTPTVFYIAPMDHTLKTEVVKLYLVPRDEEFAIATDSMGRWKTEYLGTVQMTFRGRIFHLFEAKENR